MAWVGVCVFFFPSVTHALQNSVAATWHLKKKKVLLDVTGKTRAATDYRLAYLLCFFCVF